jgi:hypothetical protein
MRQDPLDALDEEGFFVRRVTILHCARVIQVNLRAHSLA